MCNVPSCSSTVPILIKLHIIKPTSSFVHYLSCYRKMENQHQIFQPWNIQNVSYIINQKMIQSITPIQNEHICLLHLYNIDSPITLNVMTPLTTNILQHYVPPNTKCSIKLLITEDRGRASQANSKKFQPRGIRRTIKCNPISITFNIKINNQETEITPLQLAQALN